MAHVAQLVATNARERTRCLFATQQRPFRDDASAPPVWCVGRCFAVSDGAERAAFLRTLRSRLWVTYRHSFPTIAGSTLTNDAGWGCMIRSGQMLLAQTLLRKRFGDAWTRRCTDSALSARDRHAYVSLIKMFADDEDAPFSLHRIVACAGKGGKRPGEWVGPNTIAAITKVLLDEYEAQVRAAAWGHGGTALDIAVSVSGSQGHLYFDDVECDIAEAVARAAAACELPLPPPAPPLPLAGAASVKASASAPASEAAPNSAAARRAWNPVTGVLPSVGDMLGALAGGARVSAAPPSWHSSAEAGSDGAAGSVEAPPPSVATTVATTVWPPPFSLLLLLPLSAGSGVTINPIYSAQLTRLLRLPQSVGCVGGVRAKGLYFVGTQSASERRSSSGASPRATAPPIDDAGSAWQSWPWRGAGAATAATARELKLARVAEKGGAAKRGSAAGAGGPARTAKGRGSGSTSATGGGAAGTVKAVGRADDILFYLDPHVAQPSVFAAARSGAFTAAQLQVRVPSTPP